MSYPVEPATRFPPSCRNILLTGAGFTRDFGGLLASEIWCALFNDPRVRQFPELITLLSKHSPNFEVVYQRVFRGDYPQPAQEAMAAAVEAVFAAMDQTLRGLHQRTGAPDLQDAGGLIRQFQPANNTETGFIFTLNQDLLVERFFVDQLAGIRLRPLGIQRPPGSFGPFLGDGPLDPVAPKALPTGEQISSIRTNEEQNCRFAYVKLHGSTQWRDSRNRGVMVIGGAKANQIHQEPLLRWYFEVFRSVMLERRHRLLAIGYSFRDPHINEVLADAINEPGLDLAIISPQSWNDFLGSLDAIERNDQSGARSIGTIRTALLGPGSRYFCSSLVRLFPPGTGGGRSTLWEEILAYLHAR